jgi:hypothetical protein
MTRVHQQAIKAGPSAKIQETGMKALRNTKEITASLSAATGSVARGQREGYKIAERCAHTKTQKSKDAHGQEFELC